jgi:hypothetical protein
MNVGRRTGLSGGFSFVVLHPKATHKRNALDSTALTLAQKATENRGTANRVNRNMLIYLAADEDRMAELDTAVRDYLGWSDVLVKQARDSRTCR